MLNVEELPDGNHQHEPHHGGRVEIIVNGEAKHIGSREVSYSEVVRLAYPNPPTPDTVFTVTYRHAVKPHEGSLVEGQSVEVREEGTLFNVYATNKS